MSKIGILTLPFGPNYGMNLQVYALQTRLEQLGHEVCVINRKWNRIGANSGIMASIKRLFYYSIICRKIYKFYRTRVKLTQPFYTSESVDEFCRDNAIEYIIIGSDQVWRIENIRGANLDFFGGFSKGTGAKYKILSYAASFGNNKWAGTEEETESIKKLLNQFVAVAVRETTGVSLCKEKFGIEAITTLDPTLLLNSMDYPLKDNTPNESTDSVVSYILDSTEHKQTFINKVSKCLGIDCHYELYPQDRTQYSIYNISVEDWLGYINNASFIVTDSFHGMVFSILFNKQFVVLGNKERGLERFTSLLESLGLSERLVIDIDEFDTHILNKKIDYTQVNKKLEELKQTSLNYLTNNIEVKKV